MSFDDGRAGIQLDDPAGEDVEALKRAFPAADRADPEVAQPDHQAAGIHLHAAADAVVPADLEGDVGAAAAVAVERLADRPAAERVAVDQHDVVGIGEEVAEVDHGAKRAEQLRFDLEVEFDPAGAGLALEPAPHRVAEVEQVHRRLAAGAVKKVDRPQRDGAAGHRQQGLGQGGGQRPQPFSPAGAEHERPHPPARASHCWAPPGARVF